MTRIREHDTGKGFAIRGGRAYRGADGTVRYVTMIHKPGSGYSVSLNTISHTTPGYWGAKPGDDAYGDVSVRHAPPVAMSKFKKWAVAEVPT